MVLGPVLKLEPTKLCIMVAKPDPLMGGRGVTISDELSDCELSRAMAMMNLPPLVWNWVQGQDCYSRNNDGMAPGSMLKT
jgi:hypothetical protein